MEPCETMTCAEYSAAAGEPLCGTAPHVGLWLLLEVREPWQAKPLENNAFPDVVNAWVANAMDRGEEMGLKPRVQFIRHRRRDSDPITVATCLNGTLRMQQIADYSELASIDPLAGDMPISNELLYLVCTHGSRDVCCSREGLPTWQRLDQLSNGRAWQTTHLGGHRFAPNVLALPSERSYGRVFKDEVETFFYEIENNEVPFRFLRGNASLPKEAQVCEQTILERAGTYIGIENSAITFKTSTGIESIPLPAIEELLTKKACGDDQIQPVEILVPTS